MATFGQPTESIFFGIGHSDAACMDGEGDGGCSLAEGINELRGELVDRAARLGPALRGMAEDLASTRRELAGLRRENESLKRNLRDSQVRSYLNR